MSSSPSGRSRVWARLAVLIGACSLLTSCLAANSVRYGFTETDAFGTVVRADEGVVYHLPTGRIKLHFAVDPTTKVPGITAPGNDIYPDPKAALVLRYSPALEADEHYCVGRNPNGTLALVELDSVDRTGDIIVRVAETVRAAMLRAPGGGMRGLRSSKGDIKDPLDVVFNPYDPTERKAARQRIADWYGQREQDLVLAINGSEVPPDDKAAPIPEECTTAKNSVCYRTLTRIVVTVGFKGASSTDLVVDFPDLTTVGRINVTRTVFSRTVTNLTFDSGVLTAFSLSRPSPLYEAARLPLRVMNAILDVPVDFFNKITKGFQSEAGATQAAAALLKAQADFVAAQQKPAAADPNKPGNNPNRGDDIGTDITPIQPFISANVTCLKKQPKPDSGANTGS